jgi:hypothetical protein
MEQLILSQFKRLPEHLQIEALHYIQYLLSIKEQEADALTDLPAEVLAELEAAEADTDLSDTISQEEAFSRFLLQEDTAKDWWVTLSDKEQMLVQKSLEELDKGARMPHEAVRAEINQQIEKKRFSQYRGSMKSGPSVEEIDAQLNKLREEWERPVS